MTVFSFAGLERLWEQAGGSASSAPTAAAIAQAESGGRSDALNNNPSTGDYSVGAWQINYYGNLLGSRTAAYGPPQLLRANPLADARAAVAISKGGTDFGAWSTYKSGAYKSYLDGGSGGSGGGGGLLGGLAGGVAGLALGPAGLIGGSLAGGFNLGGVVHDIASPFESVYSGVTDAVGAIADAFRFVFSYRFLKLLAGAALVLTALFLLVKPQAA